MEQKVIGKLLNLTKDVNMSLIRQSLKRVLKGTAMAAALAVAATSVSAAEKVYRLKLAETWGPNFPIFGDATKNMAKMAEEMSNGRLQIRIDSANKHKAPLGVFDMVKSGQYDMGHSALRNPLMILIKIIKLR